MLNVFAGIGIGVVVFSVSYLAFALGRELRKIHRVAKDYNDIAPSVCSYRHNLFEDRLSSISEIRRRLYVAERDGRNASYQISCHVKDNKHTKTAKKVAIDKKRKKAEQEYQHDADVRGCGDGQ